MRDHEKLREHWNAAAGNMQERLAAVNAITESGPRQAIQMAAVCDVLAQRDKWRVLQVHAQMARTVALRQRLGQPDISAGVRAAAYLLQLIADGGALQVSQFATLRMLLDDLVADGMLGSDDVREVWVLSETREPWWKQQYGHPISTFDLIEAQLAG
jgi:hypothetical protein